MTISRFLTSVYNSFESLGNIFRAPFSIKWLMMISVFIIFYFRFEGISSNFTFTSSKWKVGMKMSHSDLI